MKKFIALLLCAVLALSFAACGNEPAPQPAPTEAPAATEAPTQPPVEEPAPAEAPVEEPAEVEPEADPVAELIEQVKALKGEAVSELYAAIGEPNSSDYASSCLVQGGQDGQLFYDGFTVYTLVAADGTETVYDVE